MGTKRRITVKIGNGRQNPRHHVPASEKGTRTPPLPVGYAPARYDWRPDLGIYVPKWWSVLNPASQPRKSDDPKPENEDSAEVRLLKSIFQAEPAA